MVRLVFRPYAQLRRSICTSESLQSSIRVSPDFNLARHSSPSFGSQHLCSAYSQQCEVDWKSRDCTLRIIPRADELLFAFTAPLGLVNPMTRIHVRLLGPCFETGRLKLFLSISISIQQRTKYNQKSLHKLKNYQLRIIIQSMKQS